MSKKLLLLSFLTPILLGCSAQERADLETLDNLPGVTCTDNNGQTTCGPDNPATWDQNLGPN